MSERCGTCIMPTSLPGVTLDAQKKCNYCRTFEEEIGRIPVNAVRNRHEELRDLLNAYRGKGDYDVMVPVSGGKDSMFALYLVAKVFGMKVLAL